MSSSKSIRAGSHVGERRRKEGSVTGRRGKGKNAEPGAKKQKKRRRVVVDTDDEEEEELSDAIVEIEDGADSEGEERTGSGARSRKMMSRDKLSQSTKDATRAEMERRQRLKQKQREYNDMAVDEETGECSYNYSAGSSSGGGHVVKTVLLDADKDGKPQPQPVAVHASLARHLKKHQIEGIRFLYDSTFESLSRLEEPGGGCILAHCTSLFIFAICNRHPLIAHSFRHGSWEDSAGDHLLAHRAHPPRHQCEDPPSAGPHSEEREQELGSGVQQMARERERPSARRDQRGGAE